jgi:hypothetical protein
MVTTSSQILGCGSRTVQRDPACSSSEFEAALSLTLKRQDRSVKGRRSGSYEHLDLMILADRLYDYFGVTHGVSCLTEIVG